MLINVPLNNDKWCKCRICWYTNICNPTYITCYIIILFKEIKKNSGDQYPKEKAKKESDGRNEIVHGRSKRCSCEGQARQVQMLM